jgi:hypothetical protein
MLRWLAWDTLGLVGLDILQRLCILYKYLKKKQKFTGQNREAEIHKKIQVHKKDRCIFHTHFNISYSFYLSLLCLMYVIPSFLQ